MQISYQMLPNGLKIFKFLLSLNPNSSSSRALIFHEIADSFLLLYDTQDRHFSEKGHRSLSTQLMKEGNSEWCLNLLWTLKATIEHVSLLCFYWETFRAFLLFVHFHPIRSFGEGEHKTHTIHIKSIQLCPSLSSLNPARKVESALLANWLTDHKVYTKEWRVVEVWEGKFYFFDKKVFALVLLNLSRWTRFSPFRFEKSTVVI